jgi:hypothetical protein
VMYNTYKILIPQNSPQTDIPLLATMFVNNSL